MQLPALARSKAPWLSSTAIISRSCIERWWYDFGIIRDWLVKVPVLRFDYEGTGQLGSRYIPSAAR